MRKMAIVFGGLLLVALFNSCEKGADDSPSKTELLNLKEALDVSAQQVDDAVNAIEQSAAYGLFQQGAQLKEEGGGDAPALNIYLNDLMGVYAYDPVEDVEDSEGSGKTTSGHCKSYFKRIDDSEWFVILLPHEKVLKPHDLFDFDPEDVITNNFKITTTQFLFEVDQSMKGHNYQLASRFDLEDEYAGELWVEETREGFIKSKIYSKFGFTDEYFISIMAQFNDTIKLSYSLENAEQEILFNETMVFIPFDASEELALQFVYEMLIGDIKIVRTLNDEQQIVYAVYKGDELQEDALVEVIMPNGESLSSINSLFMHMSKDIRITFNDESEVLLSELIGDNQEVLSNLFEQMKELYLSKMIVDKLAWQIYREQDCEVEEKMR
ncbi:hypothetical protein KDU71_10310 [Carboxylicivirga sediminis]|uniref:Lipoprotein n=1 Tax=Carboxylicivirga sediminis TaxID=2006564 RepID=A0A941IXD2_9BACT|nr:hypothetical protein [Carboxylicivirga sediminis]MBR8535950.1 hypothetical protein [Carboxylicivirga sediminis]